MVEWKPEWWARSFKGAYAWSLSVGDGRLRISGVNPVVDVDISEVLEFAADPAAKRINIMLKSGPVVLEGISARAAREAWDAYQAQIVARQQYGQLRAAAHAQGAAARRWWTQAQVAMRNPGWVDQASVAELERSRPDVSAWFDTGASTPPEEHVAVNACRTVDVFGWAAQRNEEFLNWEKQQLAEFFQSVEKSPLTDEQTRATVCFDNRVRVIAAAGSGKTSTMVARAGYAIRKGIARPSEILALAFNSKAASELSERLAARLGEQGEAVSSSTFHAFGLRIIRESTGSKPSIPDDLPRDNGLRRLATIVEDLRDHVPEFRRDWDLFCLVFGSQLPNFGEEEDPEFIDRKSGVRGFPTVAGDIVKSREEAVIANWLFAHGVRYEYERHYIHAVDSTQHVQYRPAFYLPDIDSWYEHWMIGPDGNPPPHLPGYAAEMAWRRQIHAHFRTRLIETTSATIRDGSGFEHLEQQLRHQGQQMDARSDVDSAGEPPISDLGMVRLMRTFMSHAKGNRLTAEELVGRAGGSLRGRLFVALFTTVLGEWDRRLHAAGQIDFEDMLNLATDHVAGGRWESPYRVVMVDEMQDTSPSRALLIKALMQTEGTFLYAVGDDWQAINRFAGSDLSVMTRFEDWFGPASTIWLDRTFRSPQSLCDVAGTFVMKNPGQIAKQVRSSAPDSAETVTSIGVKDRSEYGAVLLQHLTNLDAQTTESASVLVLGRYGRIRGDISEALDHEFAHLSVDFNTVHASKGKEADYVVVVGLERGGFPSMIEDDPLLQLAMSAPDPHPFAEERRLFYVALTRARRHVLVLTVNGRESPFLLELARDSGLALRSSTDHSPRVVCPECQKRTMTTRNGRNGAFLGCTGYPICTGTMSFPTGDV